MSIVTHWLFSYPVLCPLLHVHGNWIGFLQEVSYFEQPHCEHCFTLIVLLPCIMSTASCTWKLNWVPSGSKLFWTTSLWALLHTNCSLIPCNMSTAICTWYWIGFLQSVSYFEQPHCEHCFTLIVLLPCNMSTTLYVHDTEFGSFRM